MEKRHIAGLSAAALVLLVGCTSARSNPPPAASSSTGTMTTQSSTPDTATPSTSIDPRLAVQQAWSKFWAVNVKLHSIPSPEVEAAIASVAVQPTSGQMRTELSLFRATHLTNYGYVVNHVYQTRLKDPKTAIVNDCMDQSHFGSKYVTTGKLRTVGVAHDNTTAALAMGTDGVWRVQNIVYLLDQKC